MRIVEQITLDMLEGIERICKDGCITSQKYEVEGSELELKVTRVTELHNRGGIAIRVKVSRGNCRHKASHELPRGSRHVDRPVDVVRGLLEHSAGSTIGYSREDLSNILEAEV